MGDGQVKGRGLSAWALALLGGHLASPEIVVAVDEEVAHAVTNLPIPVTPLFHMVIDKDPSKAPCL